MKLYKEHPVYKNICLLQGDFSGKFSLVFDGKALKKTGKTTFEYTDPESGEPINVTVSGNLFKGFCLVVKTEIIQMSPPAKWYDIVLAVVAAMPFWFLIGGAIGGGDADESIADARILDAAQNDHQLLLHLIVDSASSVIRHNFSLNLYCGLIVT